MRWLIPAIAALVLACGQAGETSSPPVPAGVADEREFTLVVQSLI